MQAKGLGLCSPALRVVPRISAKSGSPSAPPPGPHYSPSPLNPGAQIHTEHPTSCGPPSAKPHIRVPSAPRNPGKVFICVTNASVGAGCGAGPPPPPRHFFFFLATLSFSSISR